MRRAVLVALLLLACGDEGLRCVRMGYSYIVTIDPHTMHSQIVPYYTCQEWVRVDAGAAR